MNTIKLEIADFLGYCDMNGVEALTSDQVEKLETYIIKCNDAMVASETPLVVDAIWDRLVEILKIVNPESEVLHKVWSDDDVSVEEFDTKDTYRYLRQEPMRSICTCKSFDCQELQDFVKRLPEGDFEAHISCKENGHGVRVVYCYGLLEDATSRGRSTAGRNITRQMNLILDKNNLSNIEAIADMDMIEIRGEVVLPLNKLGDARQYNPNIVSAFTGVSSMLRDSASEEETQLLDFVAYKVVSDELVFETKAQEYEFLEELGFTTPLYWLVDGLNKDTLLETLPSIVSDCESEVMQDANGEGGYEYYTDGLVFELNNRELFKDMGSDGKKYNLGNVALKVGYWQQDMYSGYIQTILWTDGKTKYSPVAIIADDIDVAEFVDGSAVDYISSQKEIENWKDLGVLTAGGNKVRRVPLYEPNNMIMLDAYVGNPLYFRYGGEAGVVPCFPDGTPLLDGKIKSALSADDDYGWYGDEYWIE